MKNNFNIIMKLSLLSHINSKIKTNFVSITNFSNYSLLEKKVLINNKKEWIFKSLDLDWL